MPVLCWRWPFALPGACREVRRSRRSRGAGPLRGLPWARAAAAASRRPRRGAARVRPAAPGGGTSQVTPARPCPAWHPARLAWGARTPAVFKLLADPWRARPRAEGTSSERRGGQPRGWLCGARRCRPTRALEHTRAAGGATLLGRILPAFTEWLCWALNRVTLSAHPDPFRALCPNKKALSLWPLVSVLWWGRHGRSPPPLCCCGPVSAGDSNSLLAESIVDNMCYRLLPTVGGGNIFLS